MSDDYNPALRVSYSSLTLHRQCPQAWAYRYLRGLNRDGAAVARDLGSWWHLVRAMDAIQHGRTLGSLRHSPEKLSTGASDLTLTRVETDDKVSGLYSLPNGKSLPASGEAAIAVAAAWWRTLSGDEQDAWVEESGEALPDRLAYMAARYDERWKDDRAHEAPLAVEMKFRREVPGTDAVMPGVVDLVYLDTRRNLVVVRDAKANRNLPTADAADDLSDSQVHLYAWGASPMIEEWGYGPPRALSYDRARTAPPKSPSLTLAGALSKSVTDYDLHTYLVFAAGPDGRGVPWGEEDTFVKSGKRAGEPKWGTYTAEETIIEKLSTPVAQSVWHQRTLTPVNPNIVQAHLTAVADTQRQAERTIEQFEETGAAPRNFNRLLCSWCEYAKLCRAEMVGGPRGEYDPAEYGLTTQRR